MGDGFIRALRFPDVVPPDHLARTRRVGATGHPIGTDSAPDAARLRQTAPRGHAAQEVLGKSSPFFDTWLANPVPSGDYWRNRAVGFEASRQPVLLIGGWQDPFLDQTVAQYQTLRKRGPDVALVVGPWTHGQGGGVAIRESLNWLAGSRRAHPVRIFVTGEGGWRDLPDWPPASTDVTLYPHPGSVLADAPPAADAPLRFAFDPADPTPTIGGRIVVGAAAGYRDDSALAERADVLTFTGPQLGSAFEVIGVPHVELAHSTNTPWADVAVRISDVDAKGRSRNIADGYLRVGPARSSPVRIALDPMAHRFQPGHRIRLTVAGGSFPRFARKLGTGEPLVSGTEFVRSAHILDCAGSRLTLPRPT